MEQKTLTAAIAAAYINCRVKCVGGAFMPNKHSKNEQGQAIMSPSLMADCHEGTFAYSDFKLLLSPLSAITDEHAIEVAKICYDGAGCWQQGKGIILMLLGSRCNLEYDKLKAIIDYLRSVGYDCGYGNISSLIAAGIAVDKSKM